MKVWEKKNGKYRLVNGKAPLKNIYIHFLTGYTATGVHNVSKYNYTLDFHTDETETSCIVYTTPDLSTLPVDLAARVRFDPGKKEITYTGKMSDSHYNSLLELFLSETDKAGITDIRNRSRSPNRIRNNNGLLTVCNDISMSELCLYVFNMENGESELSKLHFLKTWVDKNKAGNSYMLEAI